MALLSMTGYGKSCSEYEGASCGIEIRSVNSRFLDINCKLPKDLAYFENQLKNLIKSKISRGSISLFIDLESKASCTPMLNKTLVESIVKLSKDLKKEYDVKGELSIENIFSLPDVLVYDNASADKENLEAHLLRETEKALDALIEMRANEGQNLVEDLETRLQSLDATLDEIKVLDPERIVAWKSKFEERLKSLLNSTEIDEARILLEASIIADKLDINEEITRFKSHNQLFLKALRDEGAQGKKLNFILQEMGREANTLGTKCQSAKIQELAISLKEEIESMREQVMNIE